MIVWRAAGSNPAVAFKMSEMLSISGPCLLFSGHERRLASLKAVGGRRGRVQRVLKGAGVAENSGGDSWRIALTQILGPVGQPNP